MSCIRNEVSEFELSARESRREAKGHNMKKQKAKTPDPEMRKEYDFSGGVRGKYAKRFAQGTNIVVLDPEVARVFPDSESVNRILRELSEVLKRQKKASA